MNSSPDPTVQVEAAPTLSYHIVGMCTAMDYSTNPATRGKCVVVMIKSLNPWASRRIFSMIRLIPSVRLSVTVVVPRCGGWVLIIRMSGSFGACRLSGLAFMGFVGIRCDGPAGVT